MQNVGVVSKPKAFTSHPGKIIHRYKWNGKDELVDATEVPGADKFIYYDNAGQQISDSNSAAYRVSIIEVEIISLDKAGKLVEPSRAVQFSTMEYGADHHELRHSTGIAPGFSKPI